MKKIRFLFVSFVIIIFLIIYAIYILRVGKETRVNLYFYDKDAENLVKVSRKIKDTRNIPKSAVEELIRGPQEIGLSPVFRKDVRLKDFFIKDNIAYLDFDKNLLNYGGGTTQELGIVGSLVLTITEFNYISKVQILIEGKKIKYLPEGTEIKEPLERKDWEHLTKN